MRLIDADALKEDLIKFFPSEVLEGIEPKTLFAQIMHDIDNAPTVERPQAEWIPVNERLPEQANQSYLVTVDYGYGLISSCQRFFFGDGIGWNDDCVIAWQPLPEPYKKGGEES